MNKLFWIQLTKGKIRFALPILVLFVMLPITIWVIMNASGNSEEWKMRDVICQLHVWIPLFSGWWTIVFANAFFSSDGNELLYIFFKTIHMIVGQIVNIALYLICIVIAFCLYYGLFQVPWLVIFQLLSESVMISCLTFFISFALHNTGAALLISVVYCIYLNLFDSLQMFRFLSVFPLNTQYNHINVELTTRSLVGSVAFFGGGILIYNVYRIYH